MDGDRLGAIECEDRKRVLADLYVDGMTQGYVELRILVTPWVFLAHFDLPWYRYLTASTLADRPEQPGTGGLHHIRIRNADPQGRRREVAGQRRSGGALGAKRSGVRQDLGIGELVVGGGDRPERRTQAPMDESADFVTQHVAIDAHLLNPVLQILEVI